MSIKVRLKSPEVEDLLIAIDNTPSSIVLSYTQKKTTGKARGQV